MTSPRPITRIVIAAATFGLVSISLLAQDRTLTTDNILSAYAKVAETLKQDPLRPAFHLTPPAGCMGDPNGGIFYHNQYHIFYGLNPFSGGYGGWFWAHAKSNDLLHWEHSEPTLTPAFDLGLSSVGSGSTIIGKHGPLAFNSVGQNGSMKFWRAEFNDDLSEWSYEGKNPILTLDHPGLPHFDTFWRDPFVFEAEGRTFLIACADLFEENYVPVPLFEAKNADLTDWEYKGILFTYPKHKLRNLEVPELRPLGDKWILMASSDAPRDRVYYFVGDFDLDSLTFKADSEGILDYSGHYYAQETILNDSGELFVMAWVPGWDRPWLPYEREEDATNFPRPWNGCFAIPRHLSLNKEGVLIQRPVDSMKELRMEQQTLGYRELRSYNSTTAVDVLEEIRGNQLELQLEMELGAASFCGLNLLCDENGESGLSITWSGDMINIDGVKVPMPGWTPDDPLKLQVFIDKQVVEVFINDGRYTVSRLLKESHIKGDRIALTRLGGHAALTSLKAWKLKTIN